MIVVFAFAGMIKGMIGLGLPAVSMGLLTIAMSPFQAASLLIVPSMVTNVWQLFAEGH
ncbi:sulfite exporter TauE/SafE family protein, partial [Klebsiella pneumoniae]|nr:sulfite exporter TauE/SafE family protein [Klebsiella pneumoniae]